MSPTPGIGEESAPRFEFRSFGQDFDRAHFRMARLSAPVPEKLWERRSDEVYVMSRTSDLTNTKIRHGKLDIKTFVRADGDLELWNPLLKATFPVSASILRDEIFAGLHTAAPDLRSSTYDVDAFLAVVHAHSELAAVRVRKQRFGYMVNDTICEYAVVLINGARVVSISSESTDVDAIRRTVREVGLDGVENINYLQAIKRVIGMIHKPLANE
jgi:hypothetical protein